MSGPAANNLFLVTGPVVTATVFTPAGFASSISAGKSPIAIAFLGLFRYAD